MQESDKNVLLVVVGILAGVIFDVGLAVIQPAGRAPTIGNAPFSTWGIAAGLVGFCLLVMAIRRRSSFILALSLAYLSATVAGCILFTPIGPFQY